VRDLETGEVIADLDTPDAQSVVAQGGRGGRGNATYATSTNQAPRRSQPGIPGEARDLRLELQLMADVGLVGFPNVGKSTLIARVSAARPRIADYPFTTLAPNLGVVRWGDDRSFVLADIPGLIEGAHAGAGLGHEFLRHIERTRVLVHLVEPEPTDGTDPVENYHAIRRELQAYGHALADRPEILAISKAELPTAAEVQNRLTHVTGKEVILFSSVTGQGLDRLLQRAYELLRSQT
jgi:GTP-binding protein